MTIPTDTLEVDVLESHNTKKPNKIISKPQKAKHTPEPILNPKQNAKKIAALCFQQNPNKGYRTDGRSRISTGTLSVCSKAFCEFS
jgi:hypothetical protein